MNNFTANNSISNLRQVSATYLWKLNNLKSLLSRKLSKIPLKNQYKNKSSRSRIHKVKVKAHKIQTMKLIKNRLMSLFNLISMIKVIGMGGKFYFCRLT